MRPGKEPAPGLGSSGSRPGPSSRRPGVDNSKTVRVREDPTLMKKQLTILALAVLPLGVWAQSADEDFFGDAAPTVAETPKANTADPTKVFTESAEGVRWSGTVKTDASWSGGYVGGWPDNNDLSKHYSDGLGYDLSTKLAIDGRPDKDFRFRLALQTGYPFTTDTKNVAISTNGTSIGSTTTISPANIKIWELFSDVTINDAVFIRFGKQSASWGVSYFYSPGDVISLTAKDASDPTAEREGPVATKITVPFPGLKANLTGFVIARDSYFAGTTPSLQNLGYALQGDALVGDAQVSLGGFYQKDNAPKAVATLNTGFSSFHLPVLSDVNVFSEAVFSYGADVLKFSGSGSGVTGTQYTTISTWDKQVYYTGTAGASYTNSDANLTLRAEYLYNPFGSNDHDAALRGYNTYLATVYHTAQSSSPLNYSSSSGRSMVYGDVTTPGMHNLTALASLTKLMGNDKLSFSTLWQHSLSDGSGWVKPTFTFTPWDQLSFTWGLTTVYGDDGTQFPLQLQKYNASGVAQGTQRLMLNLGVTFGTGKY